MSVKISGVERRSPAWRKGIRPGMSLLTVNGNEIQDDFRLSILYYRTAVKVGNPLRGWKSKAILS